MSRDHRTSMLRGVALMIAVGASGVAAAGCGGVEMDADYPVGASGAYGGYGDYPPDAYIATTEPVYFGGYASYWYGGRWYYQNGGRWNHYDREPAGLYQRRMQGLSRRRTYESGGHYGGHASGRGGGRSGGHR
jgi:hypothetical protein